MRERKFSFVLNLHQLLLTDCGLITQLKDRRFRSNRLEVMSRSTRTCQPSQCQNHLAWSILCVTLKAYSSDFSETSYYAPLSI